MKKEITNKQAESMHYNLTEFAKSGIELPVETGFRIMRTIRNLENEVSIYQKEAARILSKYAQDGKTVNREDDPQAFEECVGKLKELAELKITVSVDEISIPKDLNIPMKYMEALMEVCDGD